MQDLGVTFSPTTRKAWATEDSTNLLSYEVILSTPIICKTVWQSRWSIESSKPFLKLPQPHEKATILCGSVLHRHWVWVRLSRYYSDSLFLKWADHTSIHVLLVCQINWPKLFLYIRWWMQDKMGKLQRLHSIFFPILGINMHFSKLQYATAIWILANWRLGFPRTLLNPNHGLARSEEPGWG
jgi:hypothetical protein